MFEILRPLIAPVDFKYADGGALRRRAIQCAVLLALYGQSEGNFHPWQEIIEKTILDRLQNKPASLLKKIQGDRLRQEFLTEQKDLIDGIMFVLKDTNGDRKLLPSVAISYFSSTQKLIAMVDCVAKLNAFTEIEDFQTEYQADDSFGLSVLVTAASCQLLQSVCGRFPLSCTVEETRGVFFKFVEGALPMQDGMITRTPEVRDDFEDDDDFDFDDTPSKSSSVNENDPLSEMYMAAIELESTLVKHVASFASQTESQKIQNERLMSIMLQVYRKTTLESRVKDQVLSCIPRYFNLSCFSRAESEFVAHCMLEWNRLDKFLENVPSAIIALEFMDKMISSDDASQPARVPFLDLTFE